MLERERKRKRVREREKEIEKERETENICLTMLAIDNLKRERNLERKGLNIG